MTPEIWQAKKIVDSTLHPGRKAATSEASRLLLTMSRHWPTSLPPFSDVMFRDIQFGSHSRHAHAWHGSMCAP
jgi:hypothetical protein